MFSVNWLSRMPRFRYGSHSTSRRTATRGLAYPHQLVVEKLEDRCLLSYSITDLGTLPVAYGGSSVATGINNQGQVVGYSDSIAGNPHAFLWEEGNMTDLGTLGGGTSKANGINDRGQVVGYSLIPAVQEVHAVLWDAGVMTDLGILPGYEDASEAQGINNAGQVVGESVYEDKKGQRFSHAFLWQDGVMSDLGTLEPYPSSYAAGINDVGQVVGANYAYLGDSTAFVWDSTTGMQDLRGFRSEALAINNQAQVVGGYVTDGVQHAALWEDGALTDLAGGYAYATAINNLRQVVGSYGSRPFLWEGGTLTDLNTLIPKGSGWTLIGAEGINDAGQIVGYGRSPDSGQYFHAYLLTPDESPHIPGRIRNNVLLAQLVSQSQSVVQAAVSIPMDQPNQQASVATIVDARVDGVVTSTTDPVVSGHHGRDAVFAGWSDPLVEPLSVGLLG